MKFGEVFARANECTVLVEIAAELLAQNQKWGEQNHPNGTGPRQLLLPSHPPQRRRSFAALAATAKQETDDAAAYQCISYADIFIEEAFEALAEEDPVKLRAELIQVAAVAVAWVEKIDRDKAKKEA